MSKRCCDHGPAARAWPGASVLAGAVLLACAARAAPPGEYLDADEKEVRRLVEQMGSESYQARQSAYEKLKSLGAAVVPLLKPYLKHRDPEVRARVRGIMDAYAFMKTGVLVLKAVRPEDFAKWWDKPLRQPKIDKPNTDPKRVKTFTQYALHLCDGDVLVKVGDIDVTCPEDMERIPPQGMKTYWFLRSGKLQSVDLDGLIAGFIRAPWSVERGGNDVTRGVVQLQRRRYDRAWARFRAAAEQGYGERWFWRLAAVLAEYNHDHAAGVSFYGKYHAAAGLADAQQHAEPAKGHPLLYPPLEACYLSWLMRRLAADPTDRRLAGAVCCMTGAEARNVPLAMELAGKGFFADRGAAEAQLALLYWQGRLEQAVALYRGQPDLHGWHVAAKVAVEACLRLGRVDQAARWALELQAQRPDDAGLLLPEVLAAALLTGQEETADRVYERLASGKAFPSPISAACTPHRRALRGLLRRLAATIGKLPAGGRRDATCRQLLSLAARGGLELPPALAELPPTGALQRAVHHYRMLRALRAGRYAQAREHLRALHAPDALERLRSSRSSSLANAVFWAAENAAKLRKEWSDLAGAVSVCDGPEGAVFVFQDAGRCSLLGADGRPRAVSGLEADEIAVWPRVLNSPGGTVMTYGERVYVLERQKLRWIRTYVGCQGRRSGRARAKLLRAPVAAALLRHVARAYPSRGYDRGLLEVRPCGDGWRAWVFWGDRVIASHEETLALVDLSGEIARQLGRDKAVRVFRPARREGKLLVPTEAGLWTMDASGRIRRVELPLKSNDVMVRVMEYPAREGKAYVGVVPQQGGQVCELDLAGGRCRLVKGAYCAMGPQDCHTPLPRDNAFGRAWAIEALARRAAREPAASRPGSSP